MESKTLGGSATAMEKKTAESWQPYLFDDGACPLYRSIVRSLLHDVGLGYWQDRPVDGDRRCWSFCMIKNGTAIRAMLYFDRPGVVGITDAKGNVVSECTLGEIVNSLGACVVAPNP